MGKYIKYGCFGMIVLFIFVIVVGVMTSFMIANHGSNRSESQEVNKTQNNSKKDSLKDKQSFDEYVCNVEGVGKVKGGFTRNVGVAIYDIEQADVLGNNRYARTHA